MDGALPSFDEFFREQEQQPPAILVVGSEGVGKTTFAAGAPNPVIVQTERGLGILKVPGTGVIRDWEKLSSVIDFLIDGKHSAQTVILDSVDGAEPIIHREVCRLNGWESIQKQKWGEGHTAATEQFRAMLEGFEVMRQERGMTVIYICHCHVRRFEAPDTEPYDRYELKLHKQASALLQESVDCTFFMAHRVGIIKDKKPGQKDSDSRARGAGDGSRVIYTEARPAFIAKNRYGMPPQISLPRDPSQGWAAVAAHIPYFNTTTERD